MVDNQHRKIIGYRDLSEEDIALMNVIKNKAHEFDKLICELEKRQATIPRQYGQPEADRGVPDANSIDGRQLSLARTHFEDGFMHLVRAIAQPRSF